MLAAPWLGWLIIHSQFGEAILLTLIAGITDWLDGWSARKLQLTSQTGAYLDPIADKSLLVTLFLALGWAKQIPAWLVVLVLGRDFVILVGAGIVYLRTGVTKFPPSIWGKVSTFFQLAAVVLVLLRAAAGNAAVLAFILRSLELIALGLTAIFTAWSGAHYILRGVRILQKPQRTVV